MLKELFGIEGHVVRNLFLNLPDRDFDYSNFNGTHMQDFERWVSDFKKAGMVYVIEQTLRKQTW